MPLEFNLFTLGGLQMGRSTFKLRRYLVVTEHAKALVFTKLLLEDTNHEALSLLEATNHARSCG